MATTKTIQPTGETITIPAMADQPDMSVVATDLGNITDAVNAQNQALTNIGAMVKLGNHQGTGTFTLSESISNFRFIFIQIGYYASGYPQYGQALIPVSRISINSSDTYAIRVISFNNAVGSNRILFTSATECNVVSMQSNTWYTAIFGIK